MAKKKSKVEVGPVIADDVETRWGAENWRRKKSRLFIGATFRYGVGRMEVTSRAKEGYFNCMPVPRDGMKRLVIGREEIIADRKARKAPKG